MSEHKLLSCPSTAFRLLSKLSGPVGASGVTHCPIDVPAAFTSLPTNPLSTVGGISMFSTTSFAPRINDTREVICFVLAVFLDVSLSSRLS